MKRYLTGVLAVVIAFSLAAFNNANTIAKQKNTFTNKWFVFGSGAEDQASNYSIYTPTIDDPTPPNCEASTRLCAIFANDANSDNILDSTELASYLSTFDIDHDGSLDDEQVGSSLSKKP